MRTWCIYHKNCFDGICSAWVVNKALGGDVILYPMAYGEELPGNLDEEDRVLMVDFSLKRQEMEELSSSVGSLRVYDHHKTAQAELEGLNFAAFDLLESGASLVWKYLMPGIEPPMLVRYIKDRDLWLFKEPESEAINSYIQSFKMNLESYDYLYHKLETTNGLADAISAGKAVLRYKETMVETMCQQAAIMLIEGFEVPVVNASMLFSEVGNRLCDLYPDHPFSAYYLDRADGFRQWGLRSIGDFDVSEIAKRKGGGGHKNAAGFQEALD